MRRRTSATRAPARFAVGDLVSVGTARRDGRDVADEYTGRVLEVADACPPSSDPMLCPHWEYLLKAPGAAPSGRDVWIIEGRLSAAANPLKEAA